MGHVTTIAKKPLRNDPPSHVRQDQKGKGKNGLGKKGRPVWQNDWRGRDWATNDWPRTEWPRNVRRGQQIQPQQQQQVAHPYHPAPANAKAANR